MLDRFDNIENSSNEKLFIIFSVIISLIIIGTTAFFVLTPTILEFYKQKKLSEEYYQEIQKKEKDYKALAEQIDVVFLKNEKIVKAFNHIFNKSDFLDFCNKYFQDSTVTRLEIEGRDGEYITYEFKTIMKTSSPKSFYKFLDDLSDYDNIIEIEYPIKMQGEGDYISISFRIKVYTLDPNGLRGIEMFDDED